MTFLVLFLARYDFHGGHKTGGFFFIVVLHLSTSDNLSPVVRLSLRNFCFCLVNVGHISSKGFHRRDEPFTYVRLYSST